MKTRFILLMILGVCLTGCSVAHMSTNDSDIKYTPTDSEKIEVYVSGGISSEYTILGEVVASVDDFDGGPVSVKILKKEASLLGAHAIINLKLEIGHGYFSNSVIAKGVAIRYSN